MEKFVNSHQNLFLVSFSQFESVLGPQGPPTRSKVENREDDIFEIRKYIFQGPSWNHSSTLLGVFKSLLHAGVEYPFNPMHAFFHPNNVIFPISILMSVSLDGQNHQSPVASVQRRQSTPTSHSAVPCGTDVKRMSANPAI